MSSCVCVRVCMRGCMHVDKVHKEDSEDDMSLSERQTDDFDLLLNKFSHLCVSS